jgi:hypothetical protein
LPDEEAERSIRKFCRRHNVATIIACFVVVVTISWLLTSGSDELETIGWLILPFFLVLALASALWYHLRLRAFVATYLRAATSRLNARGRIRLWVRSVPLCSVIHGGYIWIIANTGRSFFSRACGTFLSCVSGAFAVAGVLR